MWAKRKHGRDGETILVTVCKAVASEPGGTRAIHREPGPIFMIDHDPADGEVPQIYPAPGAGGHFEVGHRFGTGDPRVPVSGKFEFLTVPTGGTRGVWLVAGGSGP